MLSDTSVNRRTILKYAGAGSVTLLAGCIGGDDDEGNGGTPTSTPPDQEGQPTEEMIYVSNALTPNIDPAFPAGIPTTITDINFYDPLVFPNPDWEREALVAEEWETSEDGLTLTFSIRDDVEFHSGNQLTADDVVFSMERMAELGEGSQGFLRGLFESAEALDDTTVELNIEQPFASLVAQFDRMYILDSEVVQAEGGNWARDFLEQNEAGSGPYTLDEWVSGDFLSFEFFPDHWEGWQEDNFATFRWEEIPEMSTRMQAMQTEEADMSSTTFSIELFQQMDAMDHVDVKTARTPNLDIVHFNCQRMPTDDINVRKMMVHAIDYETVITQFYHEPMGNRARGLIPPSMPSHNDEIEPYEFDLDLAKDYLDNSVYSLEEINDALDGLYPTGNPRRTMLLLSDNLAEIDVELPVRDISWTSTTEAASSVETTPHATNLRIGSRIGLADDLLFEAHHPSRDGSYVSMSHFFNDELTNHIEQGRHALDPETRLEHYHEAQMIIHEAAPAAHVRVPLHRQPLRADVGGYEYRGSMAMHHRLNRLYRER